MELKKIKVLFELHFVMAVYSLLAIFSKIAANERFLSAKFLLFYGIVLLGLFIYTVILSYNFKDNIVIPYFISHLSHILLDLLNMKGVALFYPFKFRFSLKLCESSGSFNQLLFGLFSFCDMFLFVFLMIGINV